MGCSKNPPPAPRKRGQRCQPVQQRPRTIGTRDILEKNIQEKYQKNICTTSFFTKIDTILLSCGIFLMTTAICRLNLQMAHRSTILGGCDKNLICETWYPTRGDEFEGCWGVLKTLIKLLAASWSNKFGICLAVMQGLLQNRIKMNTLNTWNYVDISGNSFAFGDIPFHIQNISRTSIPRWLSWLYPWLCLLKTPQGQPIARRRQHCPRKRNCF